MTTMVVFAQGIRAAPAQWGDILYRQLRSARPAACRAKMLLVLAACLVAAAATPDTSAPSPAPSALNATTEILKASETGDSSKVDIVKQIRRLNDDGSYTVGYEAGDGTFKIESRDVLGNVKGTFGYIDKDGEIKRVTYSSSSDPTPVPVTTTTPSTPTMVVRMNKTVSSTTRRPLGTVVYPTRSGSALRSTSTPLPRRRPVPARTTTEETTTEKLTTVDDANSNILNLYKAKSEEAFKPRSQILKPVPGDNKDDLLTRATTTKTPHTIKPVYETKSEKEHVVDINKANTIRRELTGTSSNPHMISLRQSTGDDSTDVYGSHLSLGTVRPLFTTTTPRPKLVPIHSLVAARQKIQQQYQEVPVQEEETTVEASTGRVFDQDTIVTTNRVPVLQVQTRREPDDRAYEQPIYRRPASVHFRTNEYLRDNPGAPIPIGNQRPFLHYELQNKVLEQQEYVKESQHTQQQSKESVLEGNTVPPYDVRPVTRIIPVHVDERGVPIHGYQPRFPNYRPSPLPPLVVQPRYEPLDDMNSIQAPVSTRDLRRLLQILILRQNRLQAIMDQLVAPGPPYQSLPPLRHDPQYDYRYQNMRGQYHDDDERYEYRYEQQPHRQQPLYHEGGQYESQRYVPRRRLYSRAYDAVGAASSHVDDGPEYLPADIREALLLKMLVLAISPDFMPAPAATTEMTTVSPARKQVRNIQVLGEEGTTEMKRMPRH